MYHQYAAVEGLSNDMFLCACNQELTLCECVHYVMPGLTNVSALHDLQHLSLTKVIFC